MKRFFQSVERDQSFKKMTIKPPNDAAAGAAAAAPEPPVDGDDAWREPSKFMSWNANSLLLRLKKNREELMGLVQRLDPDIIAIQEVRIPAAGRKGEPKNQGDIKDDTNVAREDKQIVTRAFSALPLSNYRVWWSLSENKYGGTALLVKKRFNPVSITFSLDAGTNKHETDGRVVLAEFQSFSLLNTYVPNNGWKDDEQGFQRRQKWDQRMLDFVSRSSKKPLIWCGDLNVSHEEIDVSHPQFFQNARLPGYMPPNSEDLGQPGFTAAERQRFSKLLKLGDLVDSYRWLHKEQEFDCGFTWSGHPVGKYHGKRMRIDYFLLSRQLLPHLTSSDIHGHGIEMEGHSFILYCIECLSLCFIFFCYHPDQIDSDVI
ncbi:hypothetical protein O6H91_22G011400 [Diphasiastrum complanatum]|uniref:Uncharacterized protein n=1 Tax=Diphasiastrum complanatum TaxID=34168 RepID=A0ACC2ACU4_DIPCM|nr:hypothetical protein O6H91_22G011400 [Diphasiastrum complanatum]